MSDSPVGETSSTLRQAAADDLANHLKRVADELSASGRRPKRVLFGGSAFIKRRSPKGFVLNPVAPQLLLPDGRLWHFHPRMNPEGIYYDARVDHSRSEHGSIPMGDARFSFLGAVIARYNFGYRYVDGGDYYELGAITGKGGSSAHFVGVDDAMGEVIGALFDEPARR